MRPHFSVVIPVRDRAEVISRCVASVLAQTFADLEVVVVDDGSTDETVDAVRAVADARVRILRREPAGLDAARCAGIRAARGRWVAMLDADDEALPGWLARFGRLRAATGASLASCGGEQHHAHARPTLVAPEPVAGLDPRVLISTRPGAFVAERSDLMVMLDGHGGDEPSLDQLLTELVEVLVVEGRNVVATPEALVRWHEPADPVESSAHDEPELRLCWAQQSLDAMAQTPIPDPAQIVRAATIGGIAAVALDDFLEARRMFRLARQIEPSARTWARWAVAHVPPLARQAWLPSPDHDLDDDLHDAVEDEDYFDGCAAVAPKRVASDVA